MSRLSEAFAILTKKATELAQPHAVETGSIPPQQHAMLAALEIQCQYLLEENAMLTSMLDDAFRAIIDVSEDGVAHGHEISSLAEHRKTLARLKEAKEKPIVDQDGTPKG